MRITITKDVAVPDPVKAFRYRRVPELGPRVLFFSGGTALRKLSSELTDYTHNSIHIITPFDSGGSSAVLRNAFAMPAVGDVRNRLMALASRSIQGNPEIFELFAFRLPKEGERENLLHELMRMAEGVHPLIRRIPDPMLEIIRSHFERFIMEMPKDFDLRGASIGNLVLTAGYLNNRRRMDPVIYLFSKLVQVRGLVRPVIDQDLHLAAELADGRVVVGQHLLTGKEVSPLEAAIKRVWLTESLDSQEPVAAPIRDEMRDLIAEADLICYPIGSFYSSVVANVLPRGVGRAVAANRCPKVFVPNTGHDPELVGHTLTDQVRVLSEYLMADGPGRDLGDVLGFVLVDSLNGGYPGGVDFEALRGLGVEVIDTPLVIPGNAPYLDETLLAQALLSLT